MKSKVNGTIDALAHIVNQIIGLSLVRLDSIVKENEDEYALYVELVDEQKNGTEKYVQIMSCDALTAYHLSHVLKIEIED
jgi:hypothetical protein